MGKTAILLLNVGTPNSPEKKMVRKYLSEFLNDKRVIDLPWLARKILVNLVIVPFRTSKSTRLYQKLWKAEGSPLRFYGLSVAHQLQINLGENYLVELAMNYQDPGIPAVIKKVLARGVDTLILFPMYPQYASSTTGSAFEKVFKILSKETNIPSIKTVPQYFHHPMFIEAMVSRILSYNPSIFDHILFSFHGLPLRQVLKSHEGMECADLHCENEYHARNQFCYHAACYATVRALTERLSLSGEKYTVCFQSRIAKKWLSPFTDKVIIDLAQKGIQRILVVCPAFTADCLETTIEVGDEYKSLFIQNGGKELVLVESLNDHPLWVDTIISIMGLKSM